VDRIRVLIVDDSVVACRALADAVASDPALEVAGTALSGPIALRKLPLILPDLVMLDIDMPEMDGIQTLGEIRKIHPRLPVIICSGLAEKGNSYTIKALLGGASDYVTKPKHVANRDAAMEAFRRDLIGKIKAQCPQTSAAAAARPSASPCSRAAATSASALHTVCSPTRRRASRAKGLPPKSTSNDAPALVCSIPAAVHSPLDTP
jgi:two-component system chemotaxis response regulator CheB